MSGIEREYEVAYPPDQLIAFIETLKDRITEAEELFSLSIRSFHIEAVYQDEEDNYRTHITILPRLLHSGTVSRVKVRNSKPDRLVRAWGTIKKELSNSRIGVTYLGKEGNLNASARASLYHDLSDDMSLTETSVIRHLKRLEEQGVARVNFTEIGRELGLDRRTVSRIADKYRVTYAEKDEDDLYG